MKGTIIAGLIAFGIIGGAMLLTSNIGSSGSSAVPANNVSLENGSQVVDIQVRGGYQPQRSIAKAGVPTVVRFATNGTFDCSSSVRFPSLGISKLLPATGNTDVDVGVQPAGVLNGSCGMGMYRFQIVFQ